MKPTSLRKHAVGDDDEAAMEEREMGPELSEIFTLAPIPEVFTIPVKCFVQYDVLIRCSNLLLLLKAFFVCGESGSH
jgi:hypothetical protein